MKVNKQFYFFGSRVFRLKYIGKIILFSVSQIICFINAVIGKFDIKNIAGIGHTLFKPGNVVMYAYDQREQNYK